MRTFYVVATVAVLLGLCWCLRDGRRDTIDRSAAGENGPAAVAMSNADNPLHLSTELKAPALEPTSRESDAGLISMPKQAVASPRSGTIQANESGGQLIVKPYGDFTIVIRDGTGAETKRFVQFREGAWALKEPFFGVVEIVRVESINVMGRRAELDFPRGRVLWDAGTPLQVGCRQLPVCLLHVVDKESREPISGIDLVLSKGFGAGSSSWGPDSNRGKESSVVMHNSPSPVDVSGIIFGDVALKGTLLVRAAGFVPVKMPKFERSDGVQTLELERSGQLRVNILSKAPIHRARLVLMPAADIVMSRGIKVAAGSKPKSAERGASLDQFMEARTGWNDWPGVLPGEYLLELRQPTDDVLPSVAAAANVTVKAESTVEVHLEVASLGAPRVIDFQGTVELAEADLPSTPAQMRIRCIELEDQGSAATLYIPLEPHENSADGVAVFGFRFPDLPAGTYNCDIEGLEFGWMVRCTARSSSYLLSGLAD